MKIVVLGNEHAWRELTILSNDIEWVLATDSATFFEQEDADAFFNLSDDAFLPDYTRIGKPVFINCVSKTLSEIRAGENCIRINGWKGFLERTSWEIAGSPGPIHIEILTALQKKYIITPDEPGFIAARIISMIINEAFFAREENISTEEEIDIAMKLGTNYPMGPFEWANEIGIKNIYGLLVSLGKSDTRYTASALLQQKAAQS